ncbi:MAG: ABC transporter permease, partial [Lactobacillus crispatus]|nr:ABC transporter permease [Lactobacillus crispatus]
LGTAIEEYFMTTMNWNMGATIGVILIVLMVVVMLITSKKARRKKVDL